MCGESEFSVWEDSSPSQAALEFTATLLQVKIIYKQVCREASAALTVHQLFLSTESLLHSALLFSLLKTLLGLNFPLDLLSSFSRSFCKSMEKCQENTFLVGRRDFADASEHRLIERRRFQKQSHIPTFVLYCGFEKPILSSLPSKIKIKLHLHKGRNINVKVKRFFSQWTSARPGPGCWWSGSSGRWWTPAHSSAAALCLGPPESSHTLSLKATGMFKTKQSTANHSEITVYLGPDL